MSYRTLIELNHDYCPNRDKPIALHDWATAFVLYMTTGNKDFLPKGVTFKQMRHHSEPDPLAEPAEQPIFHPNPLCPE